MGLSETGGKDDRESRDEKILEHLWLVEEVARQCFRWMRFDEDLIQEGCVGLIEAVKASEQPGVEVRDFAKFARTWIRNNMRQYVWRWVYRDRKFVKVEFDDEVGRGRRVGRNLGFERVVVEEVLNGCTEKQRRRVVGVLILGRSYKEQAEEEGVAVQGIYKSIKWVEKRVRPAPG